MHLLAVRGEGYQFVPLDSRRRDPQEVATTVRGHESAQALLRDFLRGTHGLLTLAGLPVIGKTRLAVAAGRATSRSPHGEASARARSGALTLPPAGELVRTRQDQLAPWWWC